MITLHETDIDNADFKLVTAALDGGLKEHDGKQHAFFAQFNVLHDDAVAVVAYFDGNVAGCGALRQWSDGVAEIKRMFVMPEYRCRGVGVVILSGLEHIALDRGYMRCIMETHCGQVETLRFYQKNGYHQIENYGPYAGVADSISFEKVFVSG